MAQVSVKRVVALTPDQAFKIAADVASYPTFIPMITAAEIVGPVQEQGDVKRFSARLDLKAGPFGTKESFTSAVVADAMARSVTARSGDGPLKAMTCTWSFKPMAGSRCEASVNVDYHLKSKLLQMAAGAVMDRAALKVMDAFEARGRQLYPMSAIPNI